MLYGWIMLVLHLQNATLLQMVLSCQRSVEVFF
jgi:hypothetical protein